MYVYKSTIPSLHEILDITKEKLFIETTMIYLLAKFSLRLKETSFKQNRDCTQPFSQLFKKLKSQPASGCVSGIVDIKNILSCNILLHCITWHTASIMQHGLNAILCDVISYHITCACFRGQPILPPFRLIQSM